jgi:hypothetical protein
VQLERNRLLEAAAGAALAFRQGDRDAGRRLDVALGRLHRGSNPGLPWLAPEAATLGREALRDVLGGLTRKPPGGDTRGGAAEPGQGGLFGRGLHNGAEGVSGRPPTPTRASAQVRSRT